MAGLTPLPTHHFHSTTRLTHSQAHSFLSSFLERADVDAAYRPDSTLSERGPQALSTGATPNLTLSHLKRILKGMEGRRVGGAELKTDEESAEDQNGFGDSSKKRRNFNGGEGQDSATPAKKQRRVRPNGDDPTAIVDTTAGNDDDWQDAETFALEQEPIVDQDPDEADAEPQDPEEEVQINTTTPSKEDRKKLKKMRRKDERSKKEDVKRTESKRNKEMDED